MKILFMFRFFDSIWFIDGENLSFILTLKEKKRQGFDFEISASL